MPHINVRPESVRRPSLVTFFGLLGLIILTAWLLNFTQTDVRAASVFTVNSTGDGADSNTADNLCNDGAGNCTLRAAIQQANATAGADNITFQIGSGPQTIRPAQPLPEVTAPVVIDGATQPGYAGAPLIELSGSVSSGNGLVITGGDSTVRALVINRFGGTGISIGGAQGGNHVEGCYIGTDLTGMSPRGNGQEGISLFNSNNVIGGTTPAARNVISGNGSWGIEFERFCCSDLSPIVNNVIQGNYVGLNAAGNAAIPNRGGITLKLITTSAPVSNNLIGGTAPGAGNVISGNAGNGLEVGLRNVDDNNTVQGNFIGTDATGSFAVPNFNGVLVAGVSNLIGGTTPAARNVISGNNGDGVIIEPVFGNTVRGNIIGANAALTAPIPNLSSGIVIKDNHDGSIVGGTGAGEANVIAFNAVNGIELFLTGNGHRLRGNSIFSNGGDIPTGDSSVGLGIDLGPAGVTPNDADDTDFGPNRLQNFPVITSVTPGASSFNVKGTLSSIASTTYDLDFYSNSACDSSGFGEGARRVGSAQVTTDSGGSATFDLTFNVALAANQVLTATATNSEGSTSEFSQCAAAGATAVGSVNFQQTRVSVDEAGGVATFVLTRTGGSAGAIIVNYSVKDQTARAGSDYAATNGTLTFANGETSKSFTVPILEDDLDELTSETASVSLSTTGDLDALGPRSTATLTIIDNDPMLSVSIGDVSAAEGNFGADKAFEFPVTLSAPSGSGGVTLTYETESGTATGGNDFFSASSTLTIPAGQSSGKIFVTVHGDGSIEPDETFFVNITSATSATIADGRGQGTILNDDVATTFNVNSTGDGADSNLADGLCKTAANDCTLRAAIQQANSVSGTDTINFSITGTINLTGALPDIIDNLIINGPGSSLLTVRRQTGGDYRIFNIVNEDTIQDLSLIVSISGLTVANGRTADGDKDAFIGDYADSGGGLKNGGTLTLTDVILTGNSTGAGGSSDFPGRGGDGGAIFNVGALTMNNCVVRGNSTGGGGANSSFGGSGGLGGSGGGIASDGPKPVLIMTDCVVTENTTGAGGDSTGTNGRGGYGGFGAGIYHNVGIMTLTRISVSNNVTGAGGKAPLGTPGPSGIGGGIFFGSYGDHGFGMLTDSTVSGNSSHDAGGIYNSGEFRMTNTTVSGNRLFGAGGGAVKNESPFATTFTNCTITANEGAGFTVSSGSANVGNTIIAGNGGGNGPDVSGALNSQGHNLVGNVGNASGFTAAGDQVGTSAAPINARLGPLSDNGGPTLTHALLSGSPALDAGDNALAFDKDNNPLRTDQRGTGFARRADAADGDTTQTVDIGAFEAHPSIEDIADKTTNPNTSLSFSFNVGDAALGIASVTASSGNTALVPNNPSNISVTGSGSTRTLTITPAAGTGTANINVTATGTNGQSMSDTFVLTVLTSNQAPTLAAIGDVTFNEDAGTQTVNLSGISAGPNETQGLTVTAASSDTTLIPNPSVTYTSPSATGSISFAPVANRSGTATINVKVTDDGGTAGGGINTISRTFNVTVSAVNDAPVNTVPGAQTTVQHTPLLFSAANSNAISVADLDAGTDAIRVTLTATNGTVTLGSNAGLSFVTGDGIDDASVSFMGTLNAINTALNGLSFKPAQGFSGAASLQLVTDDLGHNGSGGALTDTDSVSINVRSGGAFRFASSLIGTQENVGTFSLLVTRSGGSAGAASVDYATAFSPSSVSPAVGGSACTGNVDYISTSGTLSFADGEASKAISINICDDSRHEVEDTFTVSLSNPTGSATLGSVPQTFVAILDNDPVGGLFEFGQSSYNVAEGGTLTATVKRTSDTTQAASVDYATDDGSTLSVAVPCASTTGLALDRCDFTKALGTLSFAPGESEKSFTLLVGDDSYVEGPEALSLRLSNPTGGAALGATASATVTITDDSPESTGNPIDDTTKFVTQHYRDFLNRDPDAAGLAFWVQGIDSCGADAGCREVKRIDTSAAFFLSIEFQETGYLVERTYKTAYGDATSPGVAGTVPVVRFNEFLPDTQRIGQGVVVNVGNWQQQLAANKEAYALEFVQRARFLTAFPATLTAAEFVDRLNQNAGGVLTADERAQLIASLGATPSDATKRAAALRQVAENALLREREFNRAFVLMQYFGYLRRNADDAPETGLNFAGWKFWLSKLDEFGGDFRRAEMVKAFLSSDEYRKRFGQ